MLESLEGKRGQPRVKPPFPAVVGAFGCPTVINNVETLCNVPHIIDARRRLVQGDRHRRAQHRPQALRHLRPRRAPGTYEHPIGITFREMLEACRRHVQAARQAQGLHPGRRLGADPARPTQIDIKMDFDTVAKAGSMLGSAAVIVMDDTVCMVRSVARLAKFFDHESCGQCTPCREGTNWMELVLKRIEHGEGRRGDVDAPARSCQQHRRQLALRAGRRGGRPGQVAGRALPRRDRAARPRAARCPFPRAPLLRGLGAEPRVPKVTIDDRTVEVEAGTNLIEAGAQGRRPDPPLLLPPAPVGRRPVPHVPGRDRGRDAEAADRLLDHR